MGISGSNVQFRFTSPLSAGKWHHVVYTYNGGSAGSASTAYQVFIDGVEASKFNGVGSGTLTLPADSALWFGRNHSGSNQFGGSIANAPPLQPGPELRRDLPTLRLPEGGLWTRGPVHDPQGWAFGDRDLGAYGGFGREGGYTRSRVRQSCHRYVEAKYQFRYSDDDNTYKYRLVHVDNDRLRAGVT